MLTASVLTVLSTIFVVNAQSTNPQLEVESIKAQFQNAYLVPDLIPSFDPVAYLTVKFAAGDISAGSPLAVADVQAAPTITATGANSSVTLGDLYTLAMVDPGAIGGLSTPGPTRHWLVNGVTVNNGAVTIPANATTITTYGAPLPAATDAPHRYAILLWQQPSTFAAPADLSTAGQPITQFDLGTYVSSSGLGPVVAGWYFTCTTGDAVAPTSTSAVDTATLPAASSGGNNSGSNTGSHTSTATNTASTNAAMSTVAGPFTIVASLAAAIFGVVMA
jgi:phosphatidylethanolamine-binding protein (PEBP) family uncharacterized protein